MKRRTIRAFLMIGVVAMTIGLFAAPAGAHRNDESYLYLDIGDTDLGGRVELTYPDIREVLGLRLAGSDDEIRAEVEENLALLQDYSLERTTIGADGTPWEINFDGFELLGDDDVGQNGTGYIILPFEVELPTDSVPQVLDVAFTPFLEEIDGRNNIVLISNDWQRGVFDEEANELLIVDAGSPGGSIDLGNPNQWRNFTGSLELGVDHIRTGPDHIFFILVLLLPSVLILSGSRWQPSPSFGYSFVRVVLVATMFTIAHSITFTLAGLDFLPLPPSRFTETLIALSIAAAALHNLRPILGHREWLIAFLFGLFHGMGFAGLVDDLGVNRSTQFISLLGRNVGIEIGQLVIIVISFPALYLLRRTRYFQPFFVASSLTLAALSTIWVIERAFDTDAGINDLIDKILLWPRSLWLCVAGTLIAGALYAFEQRTGRLRAVGAKPGDTEDAPAPDESAESAEPVGV